MKRAKADTLTGGTKDVNPQWYNMLCRITPPTPAWTPVAGAVTATATFPSPVSRFQQTNGKATVIEILKIFWSFSSETSLGSAYQFFSEAFLTTKQPTAGQPPTQVDGTTLAYISEDLYFNPYANTANGLTPLVTQEPPTYPIVQDFTDGAGHGILVATDNMYLTLVSQISNYDNTGALPVPFAVSSAVGAKVLYRFKEVALAEYIGIVQSQQ